MIPFPEVGYVIVPWRVCLYLKNDWKASSPATEKHAFWISQRFKFFKFGGRASLKDWALTRLQMPTSPLTRPKVQVSQHCIFLLPSHLPMEKLENSFFPTETFQWGEAPRTFSGTPPWKVGKVASEPSFKKVAIFVVLHGIQSSQRQQSPQFGQVSEGRPYPYMIHHLMEQTKARRMDVFPLWVNGVVDLIFRVILRVILLRCQLRTWKHLTAILFFLASSFLLQKTWI